MHSTRQRGQRGASAAEYGLIVSLVAVALILAMIFFGDTVSELFATSGSSVSDLP